MKYEKCITCADLGIACDGPNFLAMDTAEMGNGAIRSASRSPA